MGCVESNLRREEVENELAKEEDEEFGEAKHDSSDPATSRSTD